MSKYEAFTLAIERDPDLYPMGSEPTVGLVLRDLIAMVQARHIVELGTNKGFTTIRLIEGAAMTGGRVKTIDITDYRSPWLRLLDDEYDFILGDSIAETERLEKIDFAFIDSNHDYEHTQGEIRAVLSKMESGGLVCCHDPIACPGVTRAVADIRMHGEAAGIVLPTPIKPNFEKQCGLALLTKP